jgi:hypothetical protein
MSSPAELLAIRMLELHDVASTETKPSNVNNFKAFIMNLQRFMRNQFYLLILRSQIL